MRRRDASEHTRRDFLKMLSVAAGAAMVPGTILGRRRSSRKPNVVLIFTDDQGSIDVNCYGAKDLYTENLDRLAAEGTRFTQFYVGAPVCSPSRAALMTGRYPRHAGLLGNAPSHKGREGMPTEQVTISEMMKEAGYVTGHVGKWHLGYTPETMPNGQGYDYSFGHMGGCIDNYSHFFYWVPPNTHDLWRNGEEVWRDGEFFGDLMVDECKTFIDRNKHESFFLYWAINMPHYPLQGTEKWRKKYEHLDAPRRMYAEFISTMDEMVGEVVGHLDRLGLRDDTIIIYLSDHGHSVEARTFGGGGDSGDFRGHKFTLWEGGIRVPCIVSWPSRIPRGVVRSQMADDIADHLIHRGNKLGIHPARSIEMPILLSPFLGPLQGIMRHVDRPIEEEGFAFIPVDELLALIDHEIAEELAVVPDLLAVAPQIMRVGRHPIEEVRIIVDAPAHVPKGIIVAPLVLHHLSSLSLF